MHLLSRQELAADIKRFFFVTTTFKQLCDAARGRPEFGSESTAFFKMTFLAAVVGLISVSVWAFLC